jgi:hypothetical protein
MSDELTNRPCPYCLGAIRPQEAVTCSACGVAHHRDCRQENGRCTTRDCAGVPAETHHDAPPPAPADDLELEQLLAGAYVALRQGRAADVQQALSAARARAPEHAAVLELQGDLEVAAARYREAGDYYCRAFAADPGNALIEAKYGEVLVRLKMPQILATLPPDEEPFWQRRVPRAPAASALLSALFPGLGQWYNGDLLKGGAALLVAALSIAQLLWEATTFIKGQAAAGAPVSGSIVLAHLTRDAPVMFLVLWIGIWVFAIVDAALIAHQTTEAANRRRVAAPRAWRVT